MLAGIITENDHVYNAVTNETGKRVRLIPDFGYQRTGDGVKIVLEVYAQKIDGNGVEQLIALPKENNSIFYPNAEMDSMFSSFNESITPADSYSNKTNTMIENILLFDTQAKGMFGGDTCVPYEPSI